MEPGIAIATPKELLQGLPDRVDHVYRKFADELPHRPAFVESGQIYSYRQFADAVEAVAGDLRELGVRPGDRVMIASENSLAQAAILFAIASLNAWAVPANPRLSGREIDLIMSRSGARRVLFNCALSREAADHAARLGASIGSIGPFDGIGLSPLVEHALPEPVHADAAQQVAALLYTSGTTGVPKGVMLSHRNLLVACTAYGLVRRTEPEDRVYGVLPMSHIVGYSLNLIATLMHGATLFVVSRAEPSALADAIANEGITSIFGVPATYQRLLEYKVLKKIRRLERGRLRMISVAGAPLDLTLKARIEEEFQLPLLNSYGTTECSPGVAAVAPDAPVQDDSVGRFLQGIEHRLVDRAGETVPVGKVGELHVRGANVMLGYYRDSEATAAAIDRDNWFNTGDLGRVDKRGYLYIVGRTKEMIIRSGFNVYPAEIEAVLNAHKSVVQSAVVGRQVQGNEEIVAFVQLLPGAKIGSEEFRAYVADRLAPYKRPTEIVILDVLPATTSGKILKQKLLEIVAASDASGHPARARGSEVNYDGEGEFD